MTKTKNLVALGAGTYVALVFRAENVEEFIKTHGNRISSAIMKFKNSELVNCTKPICVKIEMICDINFGM